VTEQENDDALEAALLHHAHAMHARLLAITTLSQYEVNRIAEIATEFEQTCAEARHQHLQVRLRRAGVI
jgi:hypothetical protein